MDAWLILVAILIVGGVVAAVARKLRNFDNLHKPSQLTSPTQRLHSGYPLAGPQQPLYANSVQHGSQHDTHSIARPAGPPSQPRPERGDPL